MDKIAQRLERLYELVEAAIVEAEGMEEPSAYDAIKLADTWLKLYRQFQKFKELAAEGTMEDTTTLSDSELIAILKEKTGNGA